MSHFKTTRKGIVTSFSDAERVFLGDVVPFLTELGEVGVDPAATRLNVPVYLDDPESNDEWWRLMGPELGEARRTDRQLFQKVLQTNSYVLTDAEADAVLRVVNETRLALGVRLGIEVEEDHERIPPEDRQALDFLGWLQEELTAELTKRL